MCLVKDDADSPISVPAMPNVYCRSCHSPLVQAIEWEQEDDSSWSVDLWCPECGFKQAVILEGAELVCLSLSIEEGFVWMFDALAELHQLSETPGSLDFTHRAQTDRIRSAGR
jgi:hypothetical protein